MQKRIATKRSFIKYPAELPGINDIDSRIYKMKKEFNAINEEIERKNIEAKKELK